MTIFIVLLTTASVGFISHTHIVETTLETAENNLFGKVQLLAARMQNRYDEIQKDAIAISRMPPIEGVIRSLANQNIDPIDGSSSDRWRERLIQIFSAMLKDNPAYTQIRYIGLADQCKELVRVDQGQGDIVVISGADLQQKLEEPYMQQVLRGHRRFFFTDLTYNREHNKIDSLMLPTLRAVQPIIDKQGRLFGAIIIDVDFKKMQSAVFTKLKGNEIAYLFDQMENFLEYDESNSSLKFSFSNDKDHITPAIIKQAIYSTKEEATLTDEESVGVYIKLNIDAFHKVGVLLKVTKQQLVEPYKSLRQLSILSSFILAVFASVLTLIFAHRLMRPLIKMTNNIKSASKSSCELNLPTHHRDEIGQLAAAFQSLNDALIANKIEISSILDNTVDGIISINEKGKITTYNKACERIFQYSADEVIGKNVKILMPKPYFKEHDQYISHYLNTGIKRALGMLRRVEGKRKDGSVFPMELSVGKVDLPDHFLFTGVIRDITKRKMIEDTLEKNLQELALIFDTVSEGIIVLCDHYRYLKANITYTKFVGYSRDELLKMHYFDLSNESELDEFRIEFTTAAKKARMENKSQQYEIFSKTKMGTIKRHRNTISYMPLMNAYLITVMDFTETHNLLEKLEKLSVTDELTKLKNRKSYNDKLQELYREYRRYKNVFCVLIFDIDYFKQVNDNYGHDVGDKVLIKVAQIADANIRQTDHIFRYGGEEFVVLLPHTNKKSGIEIAEKIRKAIEARVDTVKPQTITVSIGITEVIMKDSIEDVFKRADEALYQAKANGRNQVVSI